jgi:hypothetical protein
MGENMVKKGIIIVAAVSIGIAVGAYLILSLFTATGIFESKTYINFSEIPITLEEMARTSEVIVIGKVGSTVGTEHYDDGKIRKATSSMYIDVEQELTGNYKDKRIMIKTYGDGKTIINNSVQLHDGERVLLFLSYSDSDWDGEDGYIVCCVSQKFSIDDNNNTAYNPRFGSYKLDELISIIKDARANRIKDQTINSDYVVLGKVKSIEKVSISEDEADEYTTTANVTIDKAIPDYKDKEITFFIWDINDMKDCIGEDKLCLYFIKHGTQELKYIPPEKLNKLAKYYLTSYGIYKIVDGKAYGKEYPEGIMLDELLARIKEYKGIN